MHAAEYAKRWGRGASVLHDPNAVPEPVPWLVDGLWLRGKITVVVAPEKTGKSRFIAFLLSQMLGAPQGGPVLTTAQPQGHVFWRHHGFKRILYLNAEEREIDVQARINSLARNTGIEPSANWPITYLNAAGMQLHRPQDRQMFEETWLRPGDFDVVIIDPLRRIHGGDENNNTAMAPFYNDLRRWSNQYGITIIIVHHTPKLREEDDLNRLATWIRGATDLATLVDGANMLWSRAAGPDYATKGLKRMGRFPTLADLTLLDYGDPNGWCVSLNGD